MIEMWWESETPSSEFCFSLINENTFSTEEVRKEWVVLNECGNGVTIYQTPAGIYRVEEKPDGTLVRLEYLEPTK